MLFTNGPELFDNTYRRYLLKHFRDQLPFAEVPIKLDFRSRHGGKGDRDSDDEPKGAEEAPKGLAGPEAEAGPEAAEAAEEEGGEVGAVGRVSRLYRGSMLRVAVGSSGGGRQVVTADPLLEGVRQITRPARPSLLEVWPDASWPTIGEARRRSYLATDRELRSATYSLPSRTRIHRRHPEVPRRRAELRGGWHTIDNAYSDGMSCNGPHSAGGRAYDLAGS